MSASELLKPDSVYTLSVVSREKQTLLGMATAELTTKILRKSVLSDHADEDFPGMGAVEVGSYNLHVSILSLHSSFVGTTTHLSRGEARKGDTSTLALGSVVCSEGGPQLV